MFFMSKQVSLPKISSILQEMKSAKKAIYALFARNHSITRPIIPGIVLRPVQITIAHLFSPSGLINKDIISKNWNKAGP